MRRFALILSAAVVLFIGGACVLRSVRAGGAAADSSHTGVPRPWTKAWKARLRSPHLKPAEFTRLYAAAAASRLRGAKISVPEPLTVRFRLVNGTQGSMHLDNAWYDCQDDPSARIEVCERWVKVAAELVTHPTAQAQKIVPLIRNREFLDQVPPKPGLKAEHLVADLWIVYAEDLPNSLHYLTGDTPGSYPELRQKAIQYLRSVLPKVERHGEGPSYMLTAGGDFEASLLLLDEIWDQQAKQVDGELVAVIPTRDVVLFTGSHSQAGMAALRAAVNRLHATGSYPVSQTLLVWRHGAWQEYAASRP